MQDPAIVISVNNGRANVRIANQENCENCGLCSAGKNKLEVELEDTLGVVPGDRILLEIQSKDLILLTFLIYILPILATLAGYFILFYISAKMEGLGILGAFAGFFISFFLVLFLRKKKKKQFHVRMIEKLNQEESV